MRKSNGWMIATSTARPFWFVVHPGEQPALQTVSYSKRGAIKHWIAVAGRSWPYWRRHGLTAKRVEIAYRVNRT